MAVEKRQGEWTYGDLFRLPDDKRYEIIEGELYEMPAPNLEHGEITMLLIERLLSATRSLGARLLTAPVDVFMPGADPVQPDILVLLPDQLDLRSLRGIEGPPAIVIEVLSPSTSRRDRVKKRRLYERAGVREYWIVSPESGSIEVLVLDDGAYRTHVLARGDERVTSTVLAGLSFPASAIFAEAGVG